MAYTSRRTLTTEDARAWRCTAKRAVQCAIGGRAFERSRSEWDPTSRRGTRRRRRGPSSRTSNTPNVQYRRYMRTSTCSKDTRARAHTSNTPSFHYRRQTRTCTRPTRARNRAPTARVPSLPETPRTPSRTPSDPPASPQRLAPATPPSDSSSSLPPATRPRARAARRLSHTP